MKDEDRIEAVLGEPYDALDIAPFSPSCAIYFMNGYSNATVRLRSGDELFFEFEDANTSIAASAPFDYRHSILEEGLYVPVPPPLRPVAGRPSNTPESYQEEGGKTHLLQVVSMNMQAREGNARLLIGLPFAESQPELFFSIGAFDGGSDASSYGLVQSLVQLRDEGDRRLARGYPARSFFSIYHLLETPVGTLFNKKATQMELQPDDNGKLALALPPIPFTYSLFNPPIPLYSVDDPQGEPLGEIVAAHHESNRAATAPSDVWPFRSPDLDRVEQALGRRPWEGTSRT